MNGFPLALTLALPCLFASLHAKAGILWELPATLKKIRSTHRPPNRWLFNGSTTRKSWPCAGEGLSDVTTAAGSRWFGKRNSSTWCVAARSRRLRSISPLGHLRTSRRCHAWSSATAWPRRATPGRTFSFPAAASSKILLESRWRAIMLHTYANHAGFERRIDDRSQETGCGTEVQCQCDRE